MIQKNLMEEKVVIALSGGVDSAVAAFLLKKQNARVRSVFMQNWRDNDPHAGCHDKADLIAAAAVADHLEIDLEVVNFEQAYQTHVFKPFLHDLQQGITPNPDVLCNSHIKFPLLLDHALASGERLATGHYACNTHAITGQPGLYLSEGGLKDQTYFLHQVSLAQITKTYFPLATLCKSDVKHIAKAAGFPNWSRRESTGLCFIGERHFPSFLSRYIAYSPGNIVEECTGRLLGQHKGIAFYTIGQRCGLGIGGDGPWFVARKDKRSNTLIVVKGSVHPSLWSSTVHIRQVHWIDGCAPRVGWVYAARLRHRQPLASCTLITADESHATIVFAESQWAPTPGQYAVIYDGKRCLGGGIIT